MKKIKEILRNIGVTQVYWKIRKVPRRIRGKVFKIYTLKWLYPGIYRRCSKAPVEEKKVVFIEVRVDKLSNNFQFLYQKAKEGYGMDVRVHYLLTGMTDRKEHKKRCMEMVKDIATAKYIFVDDGCHALSSVEMRPETKVIQTWHACGAFKRFGFSTADLIFGDSRKGQIKYPSHANYSHVSVSSQDVVWAYEEAMRLQDQKGVVVPWGTSRTDIFYDKEFLQSARVKLEEVFPQAKGKKVILYAPTFRGRVASATTPDSLDIGMFQKAFAEDYVLLFKHHFVVKELPEIPEEYRDFAMDCTGSMTIEDLLCVADICISDYSSLIFEYSLFERPMLFYAYDLEEYFDWRGFYYDYDALTPGPICTTNEEMVEYIRDIEKRFDKQEVVAFKEKFMSACDGHATERILENVFR